MHRQMDVTVKTRFNCAKERVESFGNNKYIAYLPFASDTDAEAAVIALMSKHMGVPTGRFELRRKDERTKDLVFQVS